MNSDIETYLPEKSRQIHSRDVHTQFQESRRDLSPVRRGSSQFFIHAATPITTPLLQLIAYVPTKALPKVVDKKFWSKLEDKHFMHIAYALANKSFQEGGCPIGGVVIDNKTRRIVGKGHNTLQQENHPYNHGETSAMRDAGRIDFSKTTLFTTLTPCDICQMLCIMRGVRRIVVGDKTNAPGNHAFLRKKGMIVDVLESQACIDLYKRYSTLYPHLHLEDWKGKAAL